ncbi:MAG: hypothetical protein C0432_00830 [Candidatus Puniceispirillum sp.]|nr:hypothetical protein [Candidatus Pelagibacter sp.]MBA4282826.1 hypothetical protein [Candidatus Puniceispirillum sp.]
MFLVLSPMINSIIENRDVFLKLIYLISIFCLISALFVVLNRNMMYSALSLIMTFLFASFLCISQNNDFLGFMLLIAYIGAIIVLILFVVMLFHDEKVNEKREQLSLKMIFFKNLLFSLCLGTVGLLSYSFKPSEKAWDMIAFPRDKELSNVQSIGNILYTDCVLPFQISGFILLAAMIGCIVLIFDRQRKKSDTKIDPCKKKSSYELNRKIILVNPKNNAGLKDIKIIGKE